MMRSIALCLALAGIAGVRPALAQAVPHGSPSASLPVSAPMVVPAQSAKDVLRMRSMEAAFARCGDKRIPVRIVGRVPAKFEPYETGVVRIMAGGDGDELIAMIKPTLDVQVEMLRAGDDPKKRAALMRRLLAYHGPLDVNDDTAREQLASMRRQIVEGRRLLALPQTQTMLSEKGTFACDGLPPGRYDAIITVEDPEHSSGSLSKYGPVVMAQIYYTAKIFVPKPKRGERLVVTPASYRLLSRYDPEHPDAGATPAPNSNDQ